MRFRLIVASAAVLAATSGMLLARAARTDATAVVRQEPRIPESVRGEHEAIHAALVEATQAPGSVGEAARALAAILHPHFVREEEIALPPLGLLAPLAAGQRPAGMTEALAMSDALRKELPRMLEEHGRIRTAVAALGEAAGKAGAAAQLRLAADLALHAKTEEEVLYPAAVLVGDLIRARMPARDRP